MRSRFDEQPRLRAGHVYSTHRMVHCEHIRLQNDAHLAGQEYSSSMPEALLILIGLSGVGQGVRPGQDLAPATQTLTQSAEPRKPFHFSLLPVPSADLAPLKSSNKFTFGARIDRQMVESSKTQIVCG